MSESLRALLRPPRRGRLVLVACGAVLAGALLWYVGMDLPHAVVTAAVALAAGIAWVAMPQTANLAWPVEPIPTDDGVRRDVATLSWSLHDRFGRIRPGGISRVRQLARSRLEPFGLDLDDEDDRAEVERLIGSDALATLSDTGGSPRLRRVAHCLDALDRLLDIPANPARTPARTLRKDPA